MKTALVFLISILSLSSCTTINITNSFNSYSDCGYSENRAISYEGVEILVKGSNCHYQEFLTSKLNKEVLLSKGYKMIVDGELVIFLEPKHHQF